MQAARTPNAPRPDLRPAQRRDRGFTLIELLVVIIIIGVLSAIAVPTYLHQRQKAAAVTAKSDLRNAAQQIELWIAQGHTEDELSAPWAWVGVTWDAPLVLDGIAIRPTRDTLIVLFGRPGVGYCLAAFNAAAGAPHASGEPRFWYDSARGGLDPRGIVPLAQRPTGACQ